MHGTLHLEHTDMHKYFVVRSFALLLIFEVRPLLCSNASYSQVKVTSLLLCPSLT